MKVLEVSKMNPWWKYENWKEFDKDLRKIDILFERKEIELKEGRIYIILGLRRTGKTIYLKNFVDKFGNKRNVLYLSCDRLSRKEILNVIKEISLRRGKLLLLLDEITSVKDWNTLIKNISEMYDHTVVVTGSIASTLKNELIPGRGAEGSSYYFSPFDFREFIRAAVKMKNKIKDEELSKAVELIEKKFNFRRKFDPVNPKEDYIDEITGLYEELQRLFELYMLSGGLPKPVYEILSEGRLSEDVLEEFIRVLISDFGKMGLDESIGMEVIEEIVRRIGSRISYHNIAKNIGISEVSVKKYLDFLSKNRVVYILLNRDLSWNTFKKREKKVVIQTPLVFLAARVYFYGESWEDLLDSFEKEKEKVFESVCISQIIWSYEIPFLREYFSFAGYFNKNGETDLLIKRDKVYQFEMKYGKVKKRRNAIVISKDEFSEGIYPASLFFPFVEKSERVL